jgi:hypothetical protein
MKALRFIALFLLPLTLFFSCSKDLNINDEWKEIMIVYGLLDPNDTIHYIKITKAFLGPGNALAYAQIPDSSNYSGQIIVTLDEYNDDVLVSSMLLDTTMITNKDSGIFYFPDQLIYVARVHLNMDHQYRITVLDTVTGVAVTSFTNLVNNFDINAPNSFSKANFVQGNLTTAEWTSARFGRLYQLNIRFSFWEVNVQDTSLKVKKSVNWLVFDDIKAKTLDGGADMSNSFYGDGFFNVIKANVPENPSVYRIPDSVEYFFTVASEDLSNYIEVTDPSNTIVQEKPIYTNIVNGIGLFSSRTDNSIFNPRKLRLSDRTYDSLVDGVVTGNLF